jgi:hypothetical protein
MGVTMKSNNEIEYEQQLLYENEKLRKKLSEANSVIEEHRRILNEKILKYGDKPAGNMWEADRVGVTWEAYKNMNRPTPSSEKK